MVSVDELPLQVAPDTAFTAVAPLRELTDRARAELTAAKERISEDPRAFETYREQATILNADSNGIPGNVALLRRLISIDANVAAAGSRAVWDFPDNVAVAGLLFVIDVETGFGRLAHLDGDHAAALDHYRAGLEVLTQGRAYMRIRSIDGPVYGVGSRAATAAAELAADREQSIEQFLSRLEANIIAPYSSLMAERNLADIRSFGAVAMFRRALQRRENTQYLDRLRKEAPRLHDALRPTDPKAAKRFQIELSAIIEELDVVLGARKRRRWEW